MSVQMNTYVLWGVVLPYEDVSYSDAIEAYSDDAFKPEANPKNEMTVLYDGMSGDYVAIGHVMYKTRNCGGFTRPLPVGGRPKRGWREGLRQALQEIGTPYAGAPGWHVVSHYR